MTHEETIKRIQELVPSIMALEFGCEVEEKPAFGSGMRNDTFNGGKVFTIVSKYHSAHSWFYLTDDGLGKEKEDKILRWHNFLGKPITLSVVLRAVEKFTGYSDDVLYVNSVGLMYIINSNKTQKDFIKQFENCIEWNLSKDNFNDQSEETKSFIGGLLTNNSKEK